MAASNTIRPTAVRRTPTATRVDSGSRQRRFSPAACAKYAACPTQQALAAATTHRHDYVSEYVNDLGAVLDMDAIRDARLESLRRSAGRRGRRLLGAHRRTLRPAPDHSARSRRPHLPLHERRLGRQDPHGLLVALCHGRPDRAEGQVRRRLRLRYRSRPARHRDAQRRPAESESLPGGGDLLSVRQPAGLARRTPASARRWYRAA